MSVVLKACQETTQEDSLGDSQAAQVVKNPPALQKMQETWV